MKAPWDVVRFDEAVLWFRSRLPNLSDDEWLKLLTQTGFESKTWASKAQLDLVAQVWAGIDTAIEQGGTFAEFKAKLTDDVRAAWGGQAQVDASRLETIFRTNVQMAYGAGRVEQLQDPDVLESRPFWRYSAIHDARTSEICKACDGVVLPANHPWWSSHQPPLHHRCRCSIISMRATAAERRGITTSPTDMEASTGFGNVEKVREFRPSTKDYPPELARNWKGP